MLFVFCCDIHFYFYAYNSIIIAKCIFLVDAALYCMYIKKVVDIYKFNSYYDGCDLRYNLLTYIYLLYYV